MNSKTIPIILISLLTILIPSRVKAEDCSDYLYKPGQSKIEPVEGGGIKIVVTSQVSVLEDDTDLEEMAREEAKSKGRNEIAKFMKTKISGKDDFSTRMVQNVLINPKGKKYDVTKVKEQLKTMSENVEGVVRGIVPIGSCYQPGKYVRVTMGIKPETIAAAGNMDATSNKPFSGYDTSTNSSDSSSSNPSNNNGSTDRKMQPFNTMPGYSGINTDF